MIISSSVLKNVVEKYQRSKKLKENFTMGEASSAGANAAMNAFLLVIAIVFFILELLLLFYSINIALNCTQGGPERIVHMVLAVTFTLPYALLNVMFNQCATTTLRSSTGLIPRMGVATN